MSSPPSNRLPSRLDAKRTLLATLDEVRNAATVVASRTQRMLSIHTHVFEKELFEHGPLLDAITRLVLTRRFAKVRVLVLDPQRVNYRRHQFAVLAQKLTTHVEIRNAVDGFRGDPASYMVGDCAATLYRLQSDRWDGIVELDDPPVARLHLDRFDAAWDASRLDYFQAVRA